MDRSEGYVRASGLSGRCKRRILWERRLSDREIRYRGCGRGAAEQKYGEAGRICRGGGEVSGERPCAGDACTIGVPGHDGPAAISRCALRSGPGNGAAFRTPERNRELPGDGASGRRLLKIVSGRGSVLPDGSPLDRQRGVFGIPPVGRIHGAYAVDRRHV